MCVEPRGICTDAAAWAGIRTILVPPGIVAVQRRSPARVKTRTPWRPPPDGELTKRAGGREWFSDHLFVEAQHGHMRAGCGASITVHISCVIVLIGALVTRPDQTLLVRIGPSLVMPATLSMVPIADAWPSTSRSLERSAPNATPQPSAAAPVPPAGERPVAPVEAPSVIEPETGLKSGAEGVEGGVAGGIVGELIGGTPGPWSPGPLRVSGSIRPPRKVKDAKPVYPQGALSDQARGTVIIEATIGIDGKVQEATVIQSIPSLDQAALDAVRQWEYEPSLLNGVRVAVIMTVIVNFAIQ